MRSKMFLWVAAALLVFAVRSVSAQPFTYQAVLTDNGTPIDGIVEVTIRAYSAPTGGTLLATSDPMIAELENGLFSSPVDLPGMDWSVAGSSGVWLEIEMARDGQGAPTLLSPRQPVTAAPVAAYALSGPFVPSDPEPVYAFSESGLPTGNYSVQTTLSINGGPYTAVRLDGLNMVSFVDQPSGSVVVEAAASVSRDFDFAKGLVPSEFDNAQLNASPIELRVRVACTGPGGAEQVVQYVFGGGRSNGVSRTQKGATTTETMQLKGFTSQTKLVATNSLPPLGIPVFPGTRREVNGDPVLSAGGVPRTAMFFVGMTPDIYNLSMVQNSTYFGAGPGFGSSASLGVNCFTSSALFNAVKANTPVSPTMEYLGTLGTVPQSFQSNSSLATFVLQTYDDGSVSELYMISGN